MRGAANPMGLSTHVLDIAEGRPGAGIAVLCHRLDNDEAVEVASACTDDDGRVQPLVSDEKLERARYRLRFDFDDYLRDSKRTTIFPVAEIIVEITKPEEHHHIPLLFAGNGYTVYRGS